MNFKSTSDPMSLKDGRTLATRCMCLADSDDGEQIDKIKEEKKGDPNSCFNETMKLWLRSGLSYTWTTLIAAIKTVGGLEATGAQIEARILAASKH